MPRRALLTLSPEPALGLPQRWADGAVGRAQAPSGSPPDTPSKTRPGAWADEPLPFHRELSCAAGFYRDALDAHRMRRVLQQGFGLNDAQLQLLRPDDALPQRFATLAQHWHVPRATGQRPAPRARSMAAAAAAWARGVLCALGSLGGRQSRGERRFNQAVQRQLCDGYCALLVHAVPQALQADVVSALQYSSVKWCAEAPLLPRRG